MDRFNKIISHELYKSYLGKIAKWEEYRSFCKHDLIHFLDVCRISWILVLEEKLSLNKEVVYGAGLLHDIGRWAEYESGADHAVESALMCSEILEDCGYDDEEIAMIKEAIAAHRIKDEKKCPLGSVLSRADKLSRMCYDCGEIGECKKFQNGEKPYLLY
jgi:putative nucleotidyltransferase with HDIG domain